MYMRTGVAGLAMLASLAVLCLLVWKSQQRDVDVTTANAQLAELAHVARLQAQVDAELNRVRVERDAELDDLALLNRQWQSANANLGRPELGWGTLLQGGQPLGQYQQAAAQADALMPRFQVALPLFVEAFANVRRLAESSLSDLVVAGEDEYLQSTVNRMLDELARYSLQGQPDNRRQIDTLVAQLPGSLSDLADAAGLLLGSKDGMQAVLDEWAALPLATSLNQQVLQIRQALARQEQQAQTYSIALAAYAGALLLVFGLIALRLQGSFSELDAINSNLEKLVEKRTNELRAQQVHLIQSEKMASLGQMVAGVAHEINTPLGYALSNVETVKESMEQVAKAPNHSDDSQERLEEADVLLEDAEHGLHQIDELVKSLKNFSRMDRSHTELFDLNEGLDTALKICQNSLKDRVEIEKAYQADLPKVHCAPSQLNQVFLNLINNGAQAIDGHGRIQISTQAVADRVEIRIRDSGCGMDEDTRAHIFEPFFTTKPVGEGTGLGLSIVFRIVEDHGGRITVESAPGEGTEFCLSLPIEAAATVADTAPAADGVLVAEPAGA